MSDRRAFLLRCGRSAIFISEQSGKSIQTRIFKRLSVGSDSDRPISPLRSAKDLKGSTMERVEWVENLDVRTFCAQGTVGVVAIIPTFTAALLPAVYLANLFTSACLRFFSAAKPPKSGQC